MTCIAIQGGIMCVSELVSLEPFGSKVWLEMHQYCGPAFYRSERSTKHIENPSRKTWAAFAKWRQSMEEGK